MEVSKYNRIVNTEKLAFNAFSGALCEFDSKEWKMFKEILAKPNNTFSREYEQIRKKMFELGYLIPEGYSEIDILKTKYLKTKFDPRYMVLTIIPTLNCNFACTYCYEKDKRGLMSNEVAESLLDFVNDKILRDNIQYLDVHWYGGEPLLAFDLIEDLSENFIKICEERGIYYQAMMVTNGFLLDNIKVKRLRDQHLTFLQITIDGPKNVHDQRRFLKGRRGSFDTIIKNLLYASKYFKVAIRVNVDRENAASLNELLEYLQSIGLHKNKNITIYCERAWGALSCRKKTIEFSREEFTNISCSFNEKVLTTGFKIDLPFIVRDAYCVADKLNGFVINYDGSILKCWEDLEDEKEMINMKIGTVKDGITNLNKFSGWMNISPFEDPECVDCEILPLCMGGCPKFIMKGHKLCEHAVRAYERYIYFFRRNQGRR